MSAWIDRIDDRMSAIVANLQAALPSRIIKRGLMHFANHPAGELELGIVMPISDGESDYSRNLGMVAKEPKHNILLVCHLKVAEISPALDIELAEMALIEELKQWLRKGVNGMDFEIESVQHSRQLEHPYGWVVFKIAAIPPKNNLY